MSGTELMFDHVGISVRDLERATAWWCAAFDLRREYRVEPPGTGLTGVMLRHPSGFRIELVHLQGAERGPAPSGPLEAAAVLGYGHVCVRVKDVAACYQKLVDLGASPCRVPAPSPARRGAVTAFVTDLDGNLVEILDRPEETDEPA